MQFISEKYLTFLDADDVWVPSKLEIQIKLAIAKDYDFICTGAYNMIEDQSNCL